MSTPAINRLVPLLIWSAFGLALLLFGFAGGFVATGALVPAEYPSVAVADDDPNSGSVRPGLPTVAAAATAAPTATALPVPLPSVSRPRLATTLSDLTGEIVHRSFFDYVDDWDAFFSNNVGANGLDGGVYAFESVRAQVLYDIHPYLTAREFLIEVDLRVSSGRGRQGLLLNYIGDPFRYADASYTRLTLDTTGIPLIEEVSPAGTRSVPFEQSGSYVPLNGMIRLSAAVSDEGLLLFVNDTYLGRAAISPPQHGLFGMITASELDGAFYRAEFDNLTISELRRTAFDS
jgi:hypothetical protein